MKILIVIAHPRVDSVTHQAAEAFAVAAKAAGHQIEFADLVAEGFDPVVRHEDEPDWSDPKKVYSQEVQTEMARINRNDATVMFFPVWWWSIPAVLKGWIDRVWNYGFAYGGSRYPHDRVMMVGLAGGPQEKYEKRGYDKAMQSQLKVGVLDFCSVPDGRVEVLYGILDNEAQIKTAIEQSKKLGSEF